MQLNSKKLERTSKIVYYAISFILCAFLILLSDKIIDDLDTTTERPKVEDFENKDILNNLESENSKLEIEVGNLNAKKATIEKTIDIANNNYENQKKSFDNWLATRETLGSPDKDKEVTDRAKRLDEFYKIQQDWHQQLSTISTQNEEIEKKKLEVEKRINNEKLNADAKYQDQLKSYEFKVFLIRLLFVGPILALGIFFFLRRRNDKYWPLYFAFTLFSLYAFFFGLVPYLPSYGGYVRYIVGIILSGGIGYYAIKNIRTYIEQKQAELKISTEERSKNVQTETAEKALENHYCPSCGKDFIIKRWEQPNSKSNDNEVYKLVTNFCRHCGLVLFKKCNSCGNQNFAHLPYCFSCGVKQTLDK